MANGKIFIGCSGWNYDGWVGTFYPEQTRQKDMLSCYTGSFGTVEVNNSFYKLPSEKSVEKWLASTPKDFCFACKASRYITHRKKLKDPREHVPILMRALKPFGRKLGPILFQLPPNWHVNVQRLEEFLDALPAGFRYTFELRDRSWLCDEVCELLKKHGAALCFYDFKGFRSPEVPTADFIYVRLHGPQERPYVGAYDGRTLAGYARKFKRWSEEGRDVYCYFDNDQKACAPFDARRLQEKVNARL